MRIRIALSFLALVVILNALALGTVVQAHRNNQVLSVRGQDSALVSSTTDDSLVSQDVVMRAGLFHQLPAQHGHVLIRRINPAPAVVIPAPAPVTTTTTAPVAPAPAPAPAPVVAATPAPVVAEPAPVAASPGEDRLLSAPGNVQALAACIRQHENGWAGYTWGFPAGTGDGGGAYQFEPGTWAAANAMYGGSVSDTSPTNQDNAFLALYNAEGTSPWAGDGCV